MTSTIVQWDPTLQQALAAEVVGIHFPSQESGGKPRAFAVSKAGFPEFASAQANKSATVVVVELVAAHSVLIEAKEKVTDLRKPAGEVARDAG